MEELIVLGQIPGTHLQVTYTWFQIIMIPAVLYVGYKYYRRQINKQVIANQRQFDVISLRSLDQA